MTFRSRTYPDWLNPLLKAMGTGPPTDALLRKPITGDCCCASEARGHTTAPAQINAIASLLFTPSPSWATLLLVRRGYKLTTAGNPTSITSAGLQASGGGDVDPNYRG